MYIQPLPENELDKNKDKICGFKTVGSNNSKNNSKSEILFKEKEDFSKNIN